MDLSSDRSREIRALASLGRVELSRAVSGVAGIHASISRGVFAGLDRALGGWSRSARTIHDAISMAVYTTTAESVEIAGGLAELAADTAGEVPSQTRRGAAAIGFLNGLIGDQLADERSPLATEMSLRSGGVRVATTADDLARAYPDATGHITVFLHGLMETEYAWDFGGQATYGARLRADIGSTEVLIRYNSGRHISDNGRDLAQLLADIVLLWPVPVTSVSLIGHSMGGLVLRSACHTGVESGAYWPSLVRHTVCLGTPHLGAPMAKGVHVATAALRATAMTRPFGDFLGRRSDGVRDLLHGTITADGRNVVDRDAIRQPAVDNPPLMHTARHLFVTASITHDPDHPVGRLIGDGLVRGSSGRGRDRIRHIGFHGDDGLHIGGAHHFTLLNDDEVHRWLRERLGPQAQLTARHADLDRGFAVG
ncbi:esterase/lipase family protein [Gordonia insulae]|uniref:GPI inositol-deacylase PGAP1-like alpha/beta domain-containing protein n=1 Tax=Gordonia insulae TaxID=2420509 RepID=A0A3G8JH89_9ACTN|nr:alpha/beta hydrolase [Gordonia insulae]AZG44457.1 hypothetical protein D7316_01043 [Gordonia insulae]